MSLNTSQQRAVDHGDGALLVYAGPGSGKTRVITHRCAALLERGVAPHRILLATFTNKAANEMKARMGDLTDASKVKLLRSGTFHSVCAKLMRQLEPAYRAGRRVNFLIYDADDQESLIKAVEAEQGIDRKELPADDVAQWIGAAKSLGLTVEDREEYVKQSGTLDPRLPEIWERYEQLLQAANAFDFDDLLLVTMIAAEADTAQGAILRGLFDHVLVDEYQDTNHVQHRLVKALGALGNVCAVGDPRQAIYGFRGADPSNIKAFVEAFPGCTTVTLEQCYRSTKNIVGWCNAVILGNDLAIDVPMETQNPAGEPIDISVYENAESEAWEVFKQIRERLDSGVPLEEIAVLYRTRTQSRPLEEHFYGAGIPVRVVGSKRFYERGHVKDLLAYLRIAANPDSVADIWRVLNVPSRGLATVAEKELAALQKVHGSMSLALQRAPLEAHAGPRVLRGFHDFNRIIAGIQSGMGGDLQQLVAWTTTNSGYAAMLENKAELARAGGKHKERIQAEERLEDLRVLSDAAKSYAERTSAPTLGSWLEFIALLTSQDQASFRAVTLSTIHAAKGLEFGHVFFVGFEQYMCPLWLALAEGSKLEEQRLAYVACSRAKTHLALTCVKTRRVGKDWQSTGPSEFLLGALESLAESGGAEVRLHERLQLGERPLLVIRPETMLR